MDLTQHKNNDPVDWRSINIPEANVFVNYLLPEIDEDQLFALASKFGEILHLKVIKINNVSLGYGFIQFAQQQDAQSCIVGLNNTQMGHKTIRCNIARRHDKASTTRANLYISGIPTQWTEDMLRQFCGQYGNIIELRVLYENVNGSRVSRGICFCRYDLHSEALQALQSIDGYIPSPPPTTPSQDQTPEASNVTPITPQPQQLPLTAKLADVPAVLQMQNQHQQTYANRMNHNRRQYHFDASQQSHEQQPGPVGVGGAEDQRFFVNNHRRGPHDGRQFNNRQPHLQQRMFNNNNNRRSQAQSMQPPQFHQQQPQEQPPQPGQADTQGQDYQQAAILAHPQQAQQGVQQDLYHQSPRTPHNNNNPRNTPVTNGRRVNVQYPAGVYRNNYSNPRQPPQQQHLNQYQYAIEQSYQYYPAGSAAPPRQPPQQFNYQTGFTPQAPNSQITPQ